MKKLIRMLLISILSLTMACNEDNLVSSSSFFYGVWNQQISDQEPVGFYYGQGFEL
jgi:hypothetical protein